MARTNQLIKGRNEVGLDVSEQTAYLKKLSDVRNNIDKTLTPEEVDYHMKTDSELLQVSKLSNDFNKFIKPIGAGTSSESDNQLKSVQRGLDNQKQSRLNILNTSNVTSNNNFGSDDIIKEMQPLQGGSSVAMLGNTTAAVAPKKEIPDWIPENRRNEFKQSADEMYKIIDEIERKKAEDQKEAEKRDDKIKEAEKAFESYLKSLGKSSSEEYEYNWTGEYVDDEFKNKVQDISVAKNLLKTTD